VVRINWQKAESKTNNSNINKEANGHEPDFVCVQLIGGMGVKILVVFFFMFLKYPTGA